MIGLEKLTPKQKLILRQMVLFRCEMCGKHEDEVGELEVHRILEGDMGGKYKPSNVKLLCKECHKELSRVQRMARGLQ